MNFLSHKSQFNALSSGLFQSAPTALESHLSLTSSLYRVVFSSPYLFVLQKMALLAFISEFAKSLLEPLLSPSDVITTHYTAAVLPHPNHWQALLSTAVLTQEAEPQHSSALSPFLPFTCPPKAGTLPVLSPYTVTPGHG